MMAVSPVTEGNSWGVVVACVVMGGVWVATVAAATVWIADRATVTLATGIGGWAALVWGERVGGWSHALALVPIAGAPSAGVLAVATGSGWVGVGLGVWHIAWALGLLRWSLASKEDGPSWALARVGTVAGALACAFVLRTTWFGGVERMFGVPDREGALAWTPLRIEGDDPELIAAIRASEALRGVPADGPGVAVLTVSAETRRTGVYDYDSG